MLAFLPGGRLRRSSVWPVILYAVGTGVAAFVGMYVGFEVWDLGLFNQDKGDLAGGLAMVLDALVGGVCGAVMAPLAVFAVRRRRRRP